LFNPLNFGHQFFTRTEKCLFLLFKKILLIFKSATKGLLMRKISLTILASVITFSLSAQAAPGVSESDESLRPHRISYVGVNPMKAPGEEEKLTKADR
jgi:hypothetical protein